MVTSAQRHCLSPETKGSHPRATLVAICVPRMSYPRVPQGGFSFPGLCSLKGTEWLCLPPPTSHLGIQTGVQIFPTSTQLAPLHGLSQDWVMCPRAQPTYPDAQTRLEQIQVLSVGEEKRCVLGRPRLARRPHSSRAVLSQSLGTHGTITARAETSFRIICSTKPLLGGQM